LVKTPRIPVELISAKVILVALGEARDSSAADEKMLTAGCHTFANATAKPSAGRCVADFLYQNCDHRHCRSKEIAARRMRVTKWQTKPTIVPAGYEFGLRCRGVLKSEPEL
jgi:hypothetical protein